MSKIRCLFLGHKYRPSKFNSLRHSIVRHKFICEVCGKNKLASPKVESED